MIEVYDRLNNRTKKPVKLLNRHIKNAKLVVDRDEQLNLLPKMGIVLEIGVYLGDHAEKILTKNNPKKLYLIEYNTEYANKLKIKFKKEINEGRVIVINESSFTAWSQFEDNYFDWIYIDAGHDYNSVSQDIKNFVSKIKTNGLMVHNDYILYDYYQNVFYGTMHAINEFCVEKDWEIIFYTLNTNDFKDVVLRKIQS